jgi:uncharacterized protein (TIGR04255 family)
MQREAKLPVVTFENPPLVELIAELRWALPPGSIQATEPDGVALPLITGDVSRLEEFFMRFGGSVQQSGFTHVERLTPPNFPLIGFQPVFRFRPSDKRTKEILYQIGAGMFSANAVPPYKSWEDFGPIVRNGVSALVKARGEPAKDAPFVAASLRYIDAFGSSLTNGLGVADFIYQVLGYRLELPKALRERIAEGGSYKPLIQLQLPLSNGMAMHIQVGEGISNKLPAIILDTTVATTSPVQANEDSVMRVLNEAQQTIHEVFIEMIEPIRQRMKPVTGATTDA